MLTQHFELTACNIDHKVLIQNLFSMSTDKMTNITRFDHLSNVPIEQVLANHISTGGQHPFQEFFKNLSINTLFTKNHVLLNICFC